MKYTAVNERFESFDYEMAEYDSAELFLAAMEHWGEEGWHTYRAFCNGQELRGTVINPNTVIPRIIRKN